ncbi:hypothetical protein BCR44DRAFT_1430881 [Catenaria anguillulae PL171]|uniref:Uncharacterized protein n=1 Tax=Catenaria anguillulae PL171 TaxID=765915 RepID=A0A1Y2HRS9_9FUNG|nr:hypothetical protein BCR44DRAFT_1430881 [Catenaria anguillulae PL171]
MQLNPWHIHVQFQVERFQHNVVARILTIVVFTIRLLVRIFIAAIDPTFVGLDSVMMRMQMVLGIALSTAAGQMLATWFVWRKLQTIERAGGKQVMFSEKGTRSGGKQRRRPSWWKLVTRTDLWVVEHLLLNVTGMALVVLSSDV